MEEVIKGEREGRGGGGGGFDMFFPPFFSLRTLAPSTIMNMITEVSQV